MVDIQWNPVREARLLKRWALLSLLVAIFGLTPVYVLILGLSGFTAAVAITLVALYTFLAIELVTRWDYRMRRRYAYPHRLGYELAGIHDFNAAGERGVELVGKWLGAKAAIVAWLSEDGEALLPIAAYGFPPSWMKQARHVPVDPHSLRQSLAEGSPLESSSINGDRWFESIGVRCERLLTDNARCYDSSAFKALCTEKRVRQRFTHAPHQRQGRALHPDAQAPLGISNALPNLGDPGGLATTLGHPLQSSATPPSARQDPADRSAQGSPSMTY